MFQGQYLITKNFANGVMVYSPWMPRGGDNLRFTLDVADIVGGNLTVTAFHKNSEDTGDGSTTSTAIGPVTTVVPPRSDAEHLGLKELVRYRFVFKASVDGTIGWVLFRMLPPVWFDTLNS